MTQTNLTGISEDVLRCDADKERDGVFGICGGMLMSIGDKRFVCTECGRKWRTL